MLPILVTVKSDSNKDVCVYCKVGLVFNHYSDVFHFSNFLRWFFFFDVKFITVTVLSHIPVSWLL